ncbi:hypothetical protein KKE14_02400 [Patescibacteria group bacterium]|nr:hypothetical protein [Patescibacteria group bacterium]
MKSWLPKNLEAGTKKTINLSNFRKARFGSLSVNSIVIIMFAAVGLLYVVAVNITSTKGSYLYSLQLERKEVIRENERLALEAARLASLAVIDGEAKAKIEIGEDGKPTGRILTETPADQTPKTDAEKEEEKKDEVTYIPRMIQGGDMTYLDFLDSTVAQR